MTASRWYRYLRFWRRDVRADIDDELRFHFDARIEELSAHGMSPASARAQAIAEFGDVDEVRRGLHEIDDRLARRRDRLEWFDALRQDVVYAARSLRRAPAVSFTIIATLALGLGVNSAMFSLLDTVFFRPPAGVARPNEIDRLWFYYRFRDGPKFAEWFDYTSYEAAAASMSGRAEMAVYRGPDRIALAPGDDPPMASVEGASASYFRVLGLRPALGRLYTTDEDALESPAPVVVVSDAFWKRELDVDTRAVGGTIKIGTKPYTVIGVMPPAFTGVDLDAVDVWRPLASSFTARSTPWYRDPNVNGFQVVLRPTTSANPRELEQRLTARLRVGTRLAADTNGVAKFGSINRARGPGDLDASMRVATRLAGVALIVLIIACANVTNLLLARAVRRRREIAIRLSLGVSRRRLVGLLVTESALLAVIAALAAVAATWWGGALLRRLLMPEVHWATAPVEWRVVAFGLAVALAAGVVAGLVPALQSLSVDLANSLKSGVGGDTSHRSRIRSSLIVVQAALSVVLLVGAGLFVRSLNNIESLDTGFAIDRLAFVWLRTAPVDSADDVARGARLGALQSRLEHVPGVERVAFMSMRPKGGFQTEIYYPDVDTLAHKKPIGFFTAVSPGFFDATGTRLLRGRDFAPRRAGEPPPLIVNEAMARALWPGQDPIGRCVHFSAPTAACSMIVGVAQTAMLLQATEEPEARFYLQADNASFEPHNERAIVLRVRPPETSAAMTAVRAILRAEFPGMRTDATTMTASMEPEYRPWKLGATLFTLFGVLALIVAAIGVYSSVSYAVSQRTHEFGVRVALGATTRNVLTHVLGDGLRTVAVGVALGIVLALAGGRLVGSLLYGISASDPVAMVVATSALMVIAAVASLAPAWRAAKADPVSALRAD
jgi:predicted permease